MKKILMISLVLLLAIAMAAPAAFANNEVFLKNSGKCQGSHDIKLKDRVSIPGGFPTWKNERTGKYSGDNPWLIQINQIQEIYVEIIYEGGFFNLIYLQRGRDWYDKNGHLVINATVCMPPGTVMQYFAVGSFGDYELAIDDPDVFMGIDEIYGFGRCCGFKQLNDGTWGRACW